jgi:multidrug resistance efflux pump
MDLLLILTYASICVVIFKVFKIPLTKWTVPTAVLGGVLLIGGLILAMNYNHPYSEVSRNYFLAVPIVPQVSGQVIEVMERPNEILEKGDVLLKLDPLPFAAKVAELTASLKQAQDDLVRAKKLATRDALALRELDKAQAKVDELTPRLEEAQWQLDNTIVHAPSRGYVTQLAVSPGVMAASIPLRPVMIFIPLEERITIGWFRQNSMLRLKPGYEAEVAFDGIPGQVFSATVLQVLPVMAEGQIPVTGTLTNGATQQNRVPGRIAVKLFINDPEFEPYQDEMPGGAFGQAAIYSDHMRHVAVMRKVLLRMASWMSYLFPFH